MTKDILINEVKKLFSEKKYEELIDLAEKNQQLKNNNSEIINLFGISKFLKKNRSDEDVKSSLQSFEEAFISGKNSFHGINGLINLIIIGIRVSSGNKKYSSYLINAGKHYLLAEKYFENDERLLNAGLALFEFLLDSNKQKKIIKKILNSNSKSIFLRGRSLFMKNYFYEWSQENHYEEARSNSIFFSKLRTKNLEKINYNRQKKISLGFLSNDLEKNHSITFFLTDVLKNINKEKFDVHIFSFAQENLDDNSQTELKKLDVSWHTCRDLSNQKVVDFIQEKKIKILIDMLGFTSPERLQIFNSRVAPLQVSWLAYCNTVGFETIDYQLADKNLIYENEKDLYSGDILYLPNIWNSHSGFNFKRSLNQLPSANNDKFVFGSLNNFRKISDETIDAWSSILKKVNNSSLILKSSDYCNENTLLEKFDSNNVKDKIIIYDRSNFKNKEDHLNLYKKIDLALDTFPYNGVTTTFESLWMNIPVVSIKGYNFNSRCGESILKNSKIKGFLADDVNKYIELAVYWSNNKEKLSLVREELYNNILNSPLFDTKKFTKHFSDALEKIYNSKNGCK